MQIKHEYEGRLATIWLHGRLTKQLNPVAYDYFKEMLSSNSEFIDLIIDLKKVVHMDSSGVGLLVQIYKSITERGGRVALVRLSDSVRATLKMTRLDDIFVIRLDIAEAREGLKI